jgi:hypothetical protein
MKLPTMSAAARSSRVVVSPAATIVTDDSVELQSIWGSAWGFTKCATKCGVSALGCVSCGSDLDCWLSCAGPKAANCIANCI